MIVDTTETFFDFGTVKEYRGNFEALPLDEEGIQQYRCDAYRSKVESDFDTLHAQAIAEAEAVRRAGEVANAHEFLNSTDWIFAKCFELGLDPQTKYPNVITQRGEARELIRRYE